MFKKIAKMFQHHYNCWWCDYPLPDCVCPIGRLNIGKPANSNNQKGVA